MSVAVRRLSTREPDFEAGFQRVLHWSAETDDAIEQRVAAILADVRQRGDAAVLECTARYDGLEAASVAALELRPADFAEAFERITPAQRDALQQAAHALLEQFRGMLDSGATIKAVHLDLRIRPDNVVHTTTLAPQFETHPKPVNGLQKFDWS